MMNPPEITDNSDQYFDYCLWPYTPITQPVGKLRSINLLAQSFDSEQLGPRALDLVYAIRQAFGAARTVWGIKQESGEISWEFYFYDYARQDRSRSITRLLQVIQPWIDCDITVNEARDYFMFSVDINGALLNKQQPLNALQMYIGNVGSNVSSGICYAVTKHQIEMKNFYFFFDAQKEKQQIVDKLTSSAYLDLSRFELDSVLWPELRQCQTIVIANKRFHDGIYFSRINVEQLLFFMRRLSYPAALVTYISQHKAQLDHMLYDVGFDYKMENGTLRILKSAYYGVF